MNEGERKYCDGCGRLITFVTAPAGHPVPCDSFTVKVVRDRSNAARQFYIGNGKIIWGRKVPEDTPGAISAWEPHNAICPQLRRPKKSQGKASPEQLAEIRRRNAEIAKRAEASLLAMREAEWAAFGCGHGGEA